MSINGKKPSLKAKRLSAKRIRGNKFVTKSGKTVKVHRTLSERYKVKQDAKALRKAERLAGMPKSRIKRIFFVMHPKRLYKYWFSRDGLLMGIKIAGISVVIGFFFLVGLFAYFRKDLPNLRSISGNQGGSIRYYDKTGKILLWEDYDAIKRVPVESKQISDNLKKATVALEDRDFYEHSGFNIRGISRAAWNNAFGGSGTQGGSTITQQLVKLTTPGFSDEKTVTRKIKELIIAVELERSYTKDEILTGYLNAAPYGTIEYGAEVAARTYFKKTAKDLTIDEAAFIAAIPKSPPTYTPHSPAFDKKALQDRQDYTINVMRELGMISQEEHDQAVEINTLAKLVPRNPSKYTGILAPHFVLAAKGQLELLQKGAYSEGGWNVRTTLDMKLQKIAEEEVKNGLSQIEAQGGDTAAFVAEDVKTGQVVALVGGGDFGNKKRAGEINYAQQPLPPGSSFKPYDYIALIENTENSGAGSVLFDSQGALEGYPCTNKSKPRYGGNCLWDYDFRHPGPVTLRYSLGGSRNIPAVKAMLIAGIVKTIETANDLGLYDEVNKVGGYKCYADQKLSETAPCYASSAIGDGAFLSLDKHVHAFATISRNGNKLPQTYIISVEDAETKESIYEWKASNGKQVVRAESAYIIADVMADPRASYMSRKMHDYKGWDFSLKTGTTNDNKDGWLMGFSTQYSAGVWVGNHTRQIQMRGFMETMTQPIWGGWMQRAHDNLEPKAREKPSGVQSLPAYVVKQHVGVSSYEPSPAYDLFPSWYKKPGNVKQGKKLLKDKVSNKMSTECTPPLAIVEVSEGDALSFSSDPFYSSGSGGQDKDDVHKCDDIKPTIALSVYDEGDGVYTLEASIGSGTHPLKSDKFTGQLVFTVDGEEIPKGSVQVKGPGVFSVKFTSIYDETKTVTAEVIDSVLYSSLDAIDFSFVLPPAPPPLPPGP